MPVVHSGRVAYCSRFLDTGPASVSINLIGEYKDGNIQIMAELGADWTLIEKTLDLSLLIYIKLRQKGITIDDGDLLIAAYCIQNKYTLVSNNQKHFENIENIQVVNWAL